MKTIYLALLFLAGIIITATNATAAPTYSGTSILLNNTIIYPDGTSKVLGNQAHDARPTVTPYALPHWMPKPYNRRTRTCKMGLVGKNWRGDNIR